jgi:spore coat protein CotF
MNQQNGKMGDRELMDDSLASQKLICANYNTFANECATPCMRDEFMSILGDEHQIQAEIFDEMSKRGWYQTQPAEQKKIDAAKQKFGNMLAQ